ERDEEELEVHDLGFIVDDRDDRRIQTVDGTWDRLEVRGHLDAEEQEEDFVETSMLATDPDGDAGADDFTSDSDLDGDGRLETLDIGGHAPGIARGFGTSVPMDIGAGGFQVRDNPLMQPVDPNQPISNDRLSDEARGLRD